MKRANQLFFNNISIPVTWVAYLRFRDRCQELQHRSEWDPFHRQGIFWRLTYFWERFLMLLVKVRIWDLLFNNSPRNFFILTCILILTPWVRLVRCGRHNDGFAWPHAPDSATWFFRSGLNSGLFSMLKSKYQDMWKISKKADKWKRFFMGCKPILSHIEFYRPIAQFKTELRSNFILSWRPWMSLWSSRGANWRNRI